MLGSGFFLLNSSSLLFFFFFAISFLSFMGATLLSAPPFFLPHGFFLHLGVGLYTYKIVRLVCTGFVERGCILAGGLLCS